MARVAIERGAKATVANQTTKVRRRRASRSEWNTVRLIPHHARRQRRSFGIGWLRGLNRREAIRWRRWKWSLRSRLGAAERPLAAASILIRAYLAKSCATRLGRLAASTASGAQAFDPWMR